MTGVRPDLFPRPRVVRWGHTVVPATTEVDERVDRSLPAEGYRLAVSDSGVTLEHADDAGLRYGRQTIEQLRTPGGIAGCEIEDRPDVATRGHMLDVSRDRVPTRETLELLVERLAACRYNHLQLYTEHTFAYRDYEPVWRDASPMTPEDLTWLDGLCAQHGIELAANQNTFGHMERWLRHDEYRTRAECPDGFERAGEWRAPTALAPTPENAEFAVGLVRELASNITSPRVNIGCDEIWEFGEGVSADAVEQRGKAAVFVEHLRRIAEPLLADGFEVQFWADMVNRDPDAARSLAEQGAIAAIWGYEAPLGIDPSTFDFDALPEEVRELARDYFEVAGLGFGPRLESFGQTGFRMWAVPGTSGWNSFVGRHRNARANILDAVDAAIDHGGEGVLVTEWGDNGHMQPPFATLGALAYGGAAAWCREANGDIGDDELASSLSRWLYDDEANALATAQIELGLVGETLGQMQPNGCVFFFEWIDANLPVEIGAPDAAALRSALDQVDAATARLVSARPTTSDAGQLLAETLLSAELVRHGLRRIARRHSLEDVDRDELAAEVEHLRDAHRRNWLARSRPGGLEDSVARMTDRD